MPLYDRVANRLDAEVASQTDVLFQCNARKRTAMHQLDVFATGVIQDPVEFAIFAHVGIWGGGG